MSAWFSVNFVLIIVEFTADALKYIPPPLSAEELWTVELISCPYFPAQNIAPPISTLSHLIPLALPFANSTPSIVTFEEVILNILENPLASKRHPLP